MGEYPSLAEQITGDPRLLPTSYCTQLSDHSAFLRTHLAWALCRAEGSVYSRYNQRNSGRRRSSWKRWLVEHELLMRNDMVACGLVDAHVATTMEPFWHKANVICHAVRGNVAGARFAADILAANGVEDPVFFALTNEMLTGVPADNIEPDKMEM